jgi:hypothetical protein
MIHLFYVIIEYLFMHVKFSCILINQEFIRSRISSIRGLEVSIAHPVGGWVCYRLTSDILLKTPG